MRYISVKGSGWLIPRRAIGHCVPAGVLSAPFDGETIPDAVYFCQGVGLADTP